jgi:hypothetical protein
VAVRAAVDDVIRRALAKLPNARHPNVEMFLADLRDALTNEGTSRRGAALYVELDADDHDDDALDAIDEALVEAAAAARAAGLDVLVEAGNAMLAAAALPGDGRYLCDLAITAALTITRPRMRVRVRAMVTAIDRSISDGVSVELPANAPIGVTATPDAIAGVVGIAVAPLDGGLLRITRT